jgi:hypothetical protein
MAVQLELEPIKPVLKAPETKLLKPKLELHSNVTFIQLAALRPDRAGPRPGHGPRRQELTLLHCSSQR